MCGTEEMCHVPVSYKGHRMVIYCVKHRHDVDWIEGLVIKFYGALLVRY